MLSKLPRLAALSLLAALLALQFWSLRAARQALTIVARLDMVPEWARPHDSSDRYLDEDHYVDYANYVAAFLKRYRPYGLRHVLIWNEPNLRFEGGGRRPEPAAYAALW